MLSMSEDEVCQVLRVTSAALGSGPGSTPCPEPS